MTWQSWCVTYSTPSAESNRISSTRGNTKNEIRDIAFPLFFFFSIYRVDLFFAFFFSSLCRLCWTLEIPSRLCVQMTPTSLGLNPERLPDCVYGIGETVERDRGKSKSWKRRNPSCRLGWIKCLSGARWISSRFLPLPCTFTRALDSLFHSAAIRPRDPPLPIRDSSARARIPFWSDTPCSSSLTEIRERERTSNADCATLRT